MIVEEIIKGWSNLIYRNPEIEQVAVIRAQKCENCDQLSIIATYYLYCKQCGCYIPAKIRSLGSTCPLKKW